ncbi:PH domain-containing protein [Spirillospora sp. NPDC048911]|uniref:PH domain-containing protein n=1 Tax=Spirillospora sp. NPDC048911 TaxID=3364527 RepID=UPI00371CDA50
MTTGSPQLKFRSTAARVGAWAWVAFAALNLADIVWRGRNMTAVVMGAVLVLGCGIAYVLGLRPAIVGNEKGLTFRNPLRDVRVPWGAVRKIEGTDSVKVRYLGAGGAEFTSRAWTLQSSPRAQARAQARAHRDAQRLPAGAAEALKTRTPTAYAAQQLTELADRHRPKTVKSGNPSKAAEQVNAKPAGAVTWSSTALAALAVPAIAVIAAILVANFT